MRRSFLLYNQPQYTILNYVISGLHDWLEFLSRTRIIHAWRWFRAIHFHFDRNEQKHFQSREWSWALWVTWILVSERDTWVAWFDKMFDERNINLNNVHSWLRDWLDLRRRARVTHSLHYDFVSLAHLYYLIIIQRDKLADHITCHFHFNANFNNNNNDILQHLLKRRKAKENGWMGERIKRDFEVSRCKF